MGDFPKAGGVAKAPTSAPIKSGKPSNSEPGAGAGGVAWGGPGKAVGNNDKNKAK